MPELKKVAISIGDINGIGPEILLKSHARISRFCQPIYCVHEEVLMSALKLLNHSINLDLTTLELSVPNTPIPQIEPAQITAQSGRYSFESFELACRLAEEKRVDYITTLPIHKYAWHLAKIPHIGHTQALSKRYQRNGIMMLGCEKMFVALFSDHIALKDVSQTLENKGYLEFLLRFYEAIKILLKNERIAVLGINPHCGDSGIMGNEDEIIKNDLRKANEVLGKDIFEGLFSGDTAFSPHNRKRFRFFVAPYHDLGLSALKALYFEESINITLGIDILRTSVDHGVGYDIAYTSQANALSYENAIILGAKLKDGYAK